MSLAQLVTSLLQDAESFLILAREEGGVNMSLIPAFCRAVFFFSWCALEGWINYIAYTFSINNPAITDFDRAFLLEKKIEVNDNGLVEITNRDDYKPTLKKIIYILQNFANYDLKHEKEDLWRRLREIEQRRNSFVHPKTREEVVIIDYDVAEECYNTIIETVDILKTQIYG